MKFSTGEPGGVLFIDRLAGWVFGSDCRAVFPNRFGELVDTVFVFRGGRNQMH